MNLYAIVKYGVYRHEITGIYDSIELATNRAVECCKAEGDDYHEFCILQFGLNVGVDDGLFVATVSRKGDVVSITAS